MKILLECISCNVSELYVQSLVLLYMPCEKFGKADDASILAVTVSKNGNVFSGKASLLYDNENTSFALQLDYSNFPDSLDMAKNFAGKLLIRLFEKKFSYIPDWGMLTGVRPARFAFDLFEKGFDDREIMKLLCEYYFVKPEKVQLAVSLSKIDKNIAECSRDREYSMYIGIPFCPSRCRYCSFVSCATEKTASLLPQYTDKLLLEVKAMKKTADFLGLGLKSIYVGGGTPSILEENALCSFLSSLRNIIPDTDIEFTFEAGRPDTVTDAKLSAMRCFGVNRVCINTQTTDNSILASVGRGHTFEQYRQAIFLAKKYDFCINTDLIAGLPNESLQGFCRSVDDVIELCPQNITIHSFSLKKSSEYTVSGTRFSGDTDIFREMLEYSDGALTDAGYFPYYMYKHKNTAGNLENTGYADSSDSIGLYNIYMMEGIHTVVACGAGASSKLVSRDKQKNKSIYNPKYPYEYLNDICDIHKKEKEIIDFYRNTY